MTLWAATSCKLRGVAAWADGRGVGLFCSDDF